MKVEFSNLNAKQRLRRGVYLAPVFLSVIALTGVPMIPGGNLRALEAQKVEAQNRLEEMQGIQERLGAIRELSAERRLGEAADRLRSMIPESLSSLEIHGILRFLVEKVGLRLSGITFGDVVDLDLSGGGKKLVLREVELGLEGRLAQLFQWLDILRAQGYPTAVLQVRLTRSSERAVQFGVQLKVGLIHFAELEPEELDPEEEVLEEVSETEVDS
ncbi:MAG: hypothetical protein DWQ01_17090 [Planctomycetota bacterium]|nr:MAG: hypothetical protein DWQ01_17090 [Planctomycetota bacterium]